MRLLWSADRRRRGAKFRAGPLTSALRGTIAASNSTSLRPAGEDRQRRAGEKADLHELGRAVAAVTASGCGR